MAKVMYISCPKCKREYYIDKIIFELNKDVVKLKCPFCKTEFDFNVNTFEAKLETN